MFPLDKAAQRGHRYSGLPGVEHRAQAHPCGDPPVLYAALSKAPARRWCCSSQQTPVQATHAIVAEFGPNFFELVAPLVWCEPKQAHVPLGNGGAVKGKVALVQNGSATFWEKAVHAQAAGAVCVLAVHSQHEHFVPQVEPWEDHRAINIPVLCIGQGIAAQLLAAVGTSAVTIRSIGEQQSPFASDTAWARDQRTMAATRGDQDQLPSPSGRGGSVALSIPPGAPILRRAASQNVVSELTQRSRAMFARTVLASAERRRHFVAAQMQRPGALPLVHRAHQRRRSVLQSQLNVRAAALHEMEYDNEDDETERRAAAAVDAVLLQLGASPDIVKRQQGWRQRAARGSGIAGPDGMPRSPLPNRHSKQNAVANADTNSFASQHSGGPSGTRSQRSTYLESLPLSLDWECYREHVAIDTTGTAATPGRRHVEPGSDRDDLIAALTAEYDDAVAETQLGAMDLVAWQLDRHGKLLLTDIGSDKEAAMISSANRLSEPEQYKGVRCVAVKDIETATLPQSCCALWIGVVCDTTRKQARNPLQRGRSDQGGEYRRGDPAGVSLAYVSAWSQAEEQRYVELVDASIAHAASGGRGNSPPRVQPHLGVGGVAECGGVCVVVDALDQDCSYGQLHDEDEDEDEDEAYLFSGSPGLPNGQGRRQRTRARSPNSRAHVAVGADGVICGAWVSARLPLHADQFDSALNRDGHLQSEVPTAVRPAPQDAWVQVNLGQACWLTGLSFCQPSLELLYTAEAHDREGCTGAFARWCSHDHGHNPNSTASGSQHPHGGDRFPGCTVVKFALEILHHAPADEAPNEGEWCALGVFRCDGMETDEDGLSFHHWNSGEAQRARSPTQHGRRRHAGKLSRGHQRAGWPRAIRGSALRIRVLEYYGAGHISLRFAVHTTAAPGHGGASDDASASVLNFLKVGHNDYAIDRETGDDSSILSPLRSVLQDDRRLRRLLHAMRDDDRTQQLLSHDTTYGNAPPPSEERMQWWLDGRDWDGQLPQFLRAGTSSKTQVLICGGLWRGEDGFWSASAATVGEHNPGGKWVPAARFCSSLDSAEQDLCEWLPFLHGAMAPDGHTTTASRTASSFSARSRSPVVVRTSSRSSPGGGARLSLSPRSPRDRSGRWTMPGDQRRRIPSPAKQTTTTTTQRWDVATSTRARAKSPSSPSSVTKWALNNTSRSLAGHSPSAVPPHSTRVASTGSPSRTVQSRTASPQRSPQRGRNGSVGRRRASSPYSEQRGRVGEARVLVQEDAARIGGIRRQREYVSGLRRQFDEAAMRGERLGDVTALV